MLGASTLVIVVIVSLPLILGKKFQVKIPPEFECITVVFIFATLYLGNIHSFYVRFWWWDIVLHISSGFLLGIIGFLLVYVINEKKENELELKPQFVALFAFMFAVSLGTFWEIFEFGMDQFFDFNMQETGLVDTMWDLIVDTLGALIISVSGWGYLVKAGNTSFLEKWIGDFIEDNPGIFREHKK